MFAWFCVSPQANYLYFKGQIHNSIKDDSTQETIAVFSIFTSIFGWFYYLWNIHQIRPDGIAMILISGYSISMLVCAILQELIRKEDKSGLYDNRQFTCIWGAFVNSGICMGAHVFAWFVSGRKLVRGMGEGSTNWFYQ